MNDEQNRKLEEIKTEISQAASELHHNADPYAACARVIDAVLLLTAFLQEL